MVHCLRAHSAAIAEALGEVPKSPHIGWEAHNHP